MRLLVIFLLINWSTLVCASTNLETSRARQESFWGQYKTKSLKQKVAAPPRELIDFLIQDNIKNHWPNRPTRAEISDTYRQDLVQALDELPRAIAQKINEKLVGIFIVNDLGGSAYTDTVLNPQGKGVAGFVILDVSMLNRTANEWATWKERSPFKTGPNADLVVEIEDANGNTRKNAIQYILLHEFGHIFSIGLPSVVPWGVDADKVGNLDSFTFTALSWKNQANTFVSLFDGEKFERKLPYYASPERQLPGEKIGILYEQLANTNFPTLYAALNPSDDFAESFVSYIHTIQMKRPWRVRILAKRQADRVFISCWGETRCAQKREALEKIIF